MRNLFIIFFIVIVSTFVEAQNVDKLTLKGGVMLGVPSKNSYHFSQPTNVRVTSHQVNPSHDIFFDVNIALGYNLGLDYLILSKTFFDDILIAGLNTGVDVFSYTQRQQYQGFIKDVNNLIEGHYDITTVLLRPHFGLAFQFIIKNNRRIGLMSNFHFANFPLLKNLNSTHTKENHVFDDPNKEIRFSKSSNTSIFRANTFWNIEINMSLNEKFSVFLDYQTTLSSSKLETESYLTPPFGQNMTLVNNFFTFGLRYNLSQLFSKS